MFSFTHIAIVFVVALLVFGPEKLPEVARVLGKALGDFRKASTDFRRVIEQEFAEIERQAREKQELERRNALEASTQAAPLEANSIAPPAAAGGPAPATPEGSVVHSTSRPTVAADSAPTQPDGYPS